MNEAALISPVKPRSLRTSRVKGFRAVLNIQRERGQDGRRLRSRMKGVLTNALRGLGFGLFLGTAFSAWITLLRVSNGTSPFERAGTPFWRAVLFYYAGLSMGGLLAGSLWSLLRRWAAGWVIIGFVFIAPVYAMFVIVNRPAGERWSAWNVGATVFGAAVVGGFAGLRMWSLNRAGWREPRTNWRFVAAVLLVGGAVGGAETDGGTPKPIYEGGWISGGVSARIPPPKAICVPEEIDNCSGDKWVLADWPALRLGRARPRTTPEPLGEGGSG